MAALNNPIFPLHANTFQGVASDETLGNKPYKAVHADEDGTISVTFNGTIYTFNVAAGEDLSIPGATLISSSASIKVS